jgi:DNA-binding GntR family transcriptional regulator
MAQAEFVPESERVTAALRNEILDGVREPGSRLVERELANDMGVSRIPVRDALRALVAEGLVTPRPRSWAVVRTFEASEIADLIEVREAFESMTFRLAAQRRTREGLARLRRVLDAEIEAAARGDRVRARQAAADFHEEVTALAGNEVLKEIQRSLGSRMRWLLGRHDDLDTMAREHERLYAAIADRDVARVQSLAAAHLAVGRAMALDKQQAGQGTR